MHASINPSKHSKQVIKTNIMSSKLVKHKNRVGRQGVMSSKTKEFLQKICYKKAASVDMTRHGFVTHNYSLLLAPKRAQKEKAHGSNSKNSIKPCMKSTSKTQFSERGDPQGATIRNSKKY